MSMSFCLEHNSRLYRLRPEDRKVHHALYSPSFLFPKHIHPAYHLILIGNRECTLDVTGCTPVPCPVRSLVLINPDIEHRFIYTDPAGTEHNSLIWRFIDEAGSILRLPLQSFIGGDARYARPYLLKILTPLEAGNYLRLHRDVEKYVRSTNEFVSSLKYFKLLTLAMELLFDEDFHRSAAPAKPSGAEALVEQLSLLIENNFVYRHFDVNYIGDELGKHPNYLNSLFSEVRGIGIGEAIRLRRIEYAKELLAGTDRRIKNIFDECGFARQNYFACAFRRETGMTPLEYRKKFRYGGNDRD